MFKSISLMMNAFFPAQPKEQDYCPTCLGTDISFDYEDNEQLVTVTTCTCNKCNREWTE